MPSSQTPRKLPRVKCSRLKMLYLYALLHADFSFYCFFQVVKSKIMKILRLYNAFPSSEVKHNEKHNGLSAALPLAFCTASHKACQQAFAVQAPTCSYTFLILLRTFFFAPGGSKNNPNWGGPTQAECALRKEPCALRKD